MLDAILSAVRRLLGHHTHSVAAVALPLPFAGCGDRHYRPGAEVVAEAQGDGLILIHLGRGSVFRLNGTGKAVWELLGQERTPREIVGQLRGLWDVPVAELERDVAAILADLLAQHLLDPLPAEVA